jgi:predicted enzyme related to lactoylglutathione lyase
MAHKVCHVEFVSNNLAESKEFYSKLFGWQMIPMESNYLLWTTGKEGEGGGIREEKVEDCGPDSNRTLVYIEVEDIEEKLATITGLGGRQVMPKTKISDEHGFFALFKDPQGTMMGLWSKG